MDISGQEYKQMQKAAAPKSPCFKNCVWAFIIGGVICAVGEIIIQLAKKGGLNEEMSRMVCAVSLIGLSVLLTAFKVYDNLAKHAGAGTLVPITGFANAIASPAIEFKSEGYVLGMAAKMFSIAGPVIVYGVVASVIYGLIYWVTTLF